MESVRSNSEKCRPQRADVEGGVGREHVGRGRDQVKCFGVRWERGSSHAPLLTFAAGLHSETWCSEQKIPQTLLYAELCNDPLNMCKVHFTSRASETQGCRDVRIGVSTQAGKGNK